MLVKAMRPKLFYWLWELYQNIELDLRVEEIDFLVILDTLCFLAFSASNFLYLIESKLECTVKNFAKYNWNSS